MERGLGDDVFEGECDLWEEISVGKISNKGRDFEWGHEWREARNNMTQSERADLSSYRLIFGGEESAAFKEQISKKRKAGGNARI